MKAKDIELVHYGPIRAYDEKKILKDDDPEGYTLEPGTVLFTNDAQDTIKGALGLKFGIAIFVRGDHDAANDEEIELTVVTIQPPVINPANNKKIAGSTEHTHAFANTSNIHYISFDEAWEVQAGDYTFMIYHGDKLFVEKTITIE